MIGYQELMCHIIFDVTMDLTRKAHSLSMVQRLMHQHLSLIVARKSIKLTFLIAFLNNLDITLYDVGSAYYLGLDLYTESAKVE